MLDIKFVRSNPDLVKQAVKNRNGNLDAVVDELLLIDAKRLELTTQVEALRAEQNTASKQIPMLKKQGENTDALMAKMKEISDKIKEDGKIEIIGYNG